MTMQSQVVLTPEFETAYQKFKEEVETLRSFHLHSMSHLGRMGHQSMFRITDDRTANLLIVIGTMMRRQPRLTSVGLAIIRAVNPNAASKEWHANLFSAAASALSLPYVDVDAATGPEPCRWSDATKPYTLGEKLLVLETLASVCDGWIGPGWAAQRLAAELGVLLPKFERS
jgi:hypothetical protein